MSRTKRALRATVDGERRSLGTVCLATAAFLVGLLPIGAVMASPAPGRPPALVLDIERDALSLGGVWERLREQAAAEVWRPEIAAQLGPWEAVAIPGPIVSGQSRAENEMLRNVWLRRRFELDTTRGARDAVLRWGGIRYGATAYVNGQEIGNHAPIGPHAIVLPRGLLRAGANEILLKIPGWAALEKSKAGVPTIPVGADLFWGQRAPRHLRRHLDRVLRRRLFQVDPRRARSGRRARAVSRGHRRRW